MAILAPSPTSLVFKVRRCEPQLIAPAKPTPHEFKLLSDVDDMERCQIPVTQFYRFDHSMQGKDPVIVIREALAQTLGFYYPFAGRLREGPDSKFTVECTGEGAIFIEADAGVTLDHFVDAPHPPFWFMDELLFDVPSSGEMLNCPLLLIQVTRPKCRGFIFALRFNHVMTDGIGIVQFMNAMACMWRCHTIALRLNPEDDVRLIYIVNVRDRFCPRLPAGYYGNAIVASAILTTVGKLCQNPIEYALELVKTAKTNVSEEYARSLIDLMVIKSRPRLPMVRSYIVSDLTRVRSRDVNFGWGKAVYRGLAKVFPEPNKEPINFYIPLKNSKGDNGILVPVYLQSLAMERFLKELHCMLKDQSDSNPMSKLIISSL
ncbi:benzyl alcohol o-benzoyltransferase [Quercus suber]|uniref:Benzyl alcohol o-benzoyltransferase n=1 Tax=Quercus suber TaxID=58331 RepID=A0AAW0JKB1_QUESU